MQWLLEPNVFGAGAPPLEGAARAAGHRVVPWPAELSNAGLPAPALAAALADRLDEQAPVVFHGSLALAAALARSRWRPGAYGNAAACAFSAWARVVPERLASPRWRATTVAELVAAPRELAGELAVDGRVFVRPDSALKPFAGRVVALEGLTAAALDHGFYYDDLALPIVLAPVQVLGAEWRLVVVARRVVAASAYVAAGRRADSSAIPAEVSRTAEQVAGELAAAGAEPEEVYVLDLVETAAGLRLVELNPFSGSDLYACSAEAVVHAVARAAAWR